MLSIVNRRYSVRIVTSADVGAAIRERRLAQGLDQGALAARIGATRQWVINIEQGHPRAALGLVLRAMAALDLTLNTLPTKATLPGKNTPDIDAIIATAKRKTR
jgi:transcriptional regulator with XRE-family HTH domain